MTSPAIDRPLTPRELLRLRRALDAKLIDDIFGRALRDESPMPLYNPRLVATGPRTSSGPSPENG